MADTVERTLYYRVQWGDCPPFGPDNAWSALWGAERSADGSQTVCGCSGTEREWEDPCDQCAYGCQACGGAGRRTYRCRSCGGTGWQDCVRGYSAEDSPEALARYFTDLARDGVVGPADTVVVFTGTWTGSGFDGEPCVVPDMEYVETLTWAEFAARYAAG